MSTALYRRYRPETFAEVIGQDHVTAPLVAALTKDRINHAYLFSGPRGCGKTTSARILARCLNCAQGPTATPCGVCESCTDLARGGPGSLDVVEIDAASHGGVDDARNLRERAAYAPARDRYKIFIIDEAHMVSTQGFNALLKIVEEPPAHVRFVFATTEPDKVIGTIRSRTHHYPFRLVPPERLQAYLAELCQAEGVAIGHGVLPLVVRAGGGSVRDSLSVLDQLIAGAGPDGLDYPMAVSLLGYTDTTLLDDVVDGLSAGDGAAVFGVVDRVIQSGHDPRRFVEDLLERLRDLLVVVAVPDGGHAVLRSLPADQLERMRGQAGRFGRAELSRAADVTNAALTEMTGATSPRLQLELLCARLLLPGAEDSERGLRARLDRIEKRLGVAPSGRAAPPPGSSPGPSTTGLGESTSPEQVRSPAQAPVAAAAPVTTTPDPTRAPDPVRAAEVAAGWDVPRPQPQPQPRPQPRPQPEASRRQPAAVADRPPEVPPQAALEAPVSEASALGAGTMTTEQIRRMWPDVLNALSHLKRATWSLISQNAQVIDYDGSRLLIGFGTSGLASAFGRGAHQEFLRQALIDVIGLDCRVEPHVGERVSPAEPSGRAAGPGGGGQGAGHGDPRSGQAAGRRPGDPGDGGWGTPPGERPPSGPARSGPAPSRTSRPAEGRPAGREPVRRDSVVPAPPDEDIPPPLDEPPPDDAPPPPPDDGPRGGRGARPHPGPARQAPVEAPVRAAHEASERAPHHTSDQAPHHAPQQAPQRTSQQTPAHPSGRPTQPVQPARQTSPPRPTVSAALDHDISRDDPEIEGSGMVGRAVVEQLLGGTVIEERDE
ncbi:MAG: DNA polymerase III subunit gamma and tau [Kineosporiaceae bacterium]|nr:DNA polymerase III subunit gamma and tau [Kineosporiaceae bacterium]